MAARLDPEPISAIHRMVDLGFSNPTDVLRRLAGIGIIVGRKAVSDHIKDYRYSKAEWPIDRPDAKVESEPWTHPSGLADTDPRRHITPLVGRAEPTALPPPSPEVERTVTETGSTTTVEVTTSELVCSREDAIRVCKIDLTRDVVIRCRYNAYQVATKEKQPDGTHRTRTSQLFAVSVETKPIVLKPLMDAIETVFGRFAEQAPAYQPAKHIGGRVMLQFDLMDVHFGKLAWRAESGEDYDLKIAEQVFANAVDDLILEAMGRKVEKIIVPFGNDYCHVDSGRNETTSGTRVETDGRFGKIFEVALMAFINALERMKEIAPVDVVLIPGNHDEQTAMTMAWAIKQRFHKCPDVIVDTTPGPTKYRMYGKTLFGYEHGDSINDSQVRDLPAAMLMEAPKEWLAEAEFFEWIVGHGHRERKFTTRDTDTKVGIVYRFLHSLSATDFWHKKKRFIGARRAAEVYRYDRDAGYLGHALALARTA